MVLFIIVSLVLPQIVYADSFNSNKATALMNITFQCGCKRIGTGAMIGRRGLITAGHNLYCKDHGKPLKSCSFLFGAKSLNSGLKRYDGAFSYRVYDTFQNGYSTFNDIGYVVFEKALGDSTSWYASWAGSDDDLNMEYTNIYNYSEKGRLEYYRSIQYVANNKQIYWDGFIGYEAGEGGPVFFTYEGLEYPTVVAVYTHYDLSGSSYGRRITSNIINDMRADGAFN